MDLDTKGKLYWEKYLSTLDIVPLNPHVESGIAGNENTADQLLELYLSGKKTAGSGLVKDYKLAGDPLPKAGNYWIILDSTRNPRCIVKTIRTEVHQFAKVPVEIAVAEGEGDLSLEHWRDAHIEFFTPFLKAWDIEDLAREDVITEFFEVVYQ
jgi:5-formyltetrahydrofolate cyclo-ligase